MSDDIRHHPRFTDATIALARAGLDLYSGNRFLNLLTNDRGRFIISLLIVAFARDGEGLTARRLGAACVATGLCSDGRARALLHLMRWSGHVEASGHGFRQTEKLMALHRERLRRVLPAIIAVLPGREAALDLIETPGFAEAFCAAQGQAFLAGRRAGEGAPDVVPIVERNAGLLVLIALYLIKVGADPGPLTVAGLARRFHVSRPHINKLVQLAEQRDLARRSAEGLSPGPALRAAVQSVFATVIATNRDILDEVLASTGGEPSDCDDALRHRAEPQATKRSSL